MFENYENLDKDYVAQNTRANDPAGKEYKKTEVEIIENMLGVFSGYKWYSKQQPTIEFDINEYVWVEKDAIVSLMDGEAPDGTTAGTYNQKFYNLYNEKVWICKSKGQMIYNWILQDEFKLPIKGDKKVLIFENTEPIVLKIFDYKGDLFYEQELSPEQRSFEVDSELAEKLFPQTYYLDFYINNKKVKRIPAVIVDERNAFNKDITKKFDNEGGDPIGMGFTSGGLI